MEDIGGIILKNTIVDNEIVSFRKYDGQRTLVILICLTGSIRSHESNPSTYDQSEDIEREAILEAC